MYNAACDFDVIFRLKLAHNEPHCYCCVRKVLPVGMQRDRRKYNKKRVEHDLINLKEEPSKG